MVSKKSDREPKRNLEREQREPRANSRETRVYGLHACLTIYRLRPDDIIRVYVVDARKGEFGHVLKWCAQRKKAYHIIPDYEMERVAATKHHEGVCFLVRDKKQPTFEEIVASHKSSKSPSCLVYLEGVGNPHNFGAIVRVCAHFGVDAILIDNSSPMTLSGAVHRISEGGLEQVPVVAVDDIRGCLRELKLNSYAIFATVAEKGRNLYTEKIPKRVVFMFGSEGPGLTKEIIRISDRAVTIPGSGTVQSLNVACSSAVVLGEYMRQHSADH